MNLIESIRSVPENYKDRTLTLEPESSTSKIGERLQELRDIWELEVRGKASGLGIAMGLVITKYGFDENYVRDAFIGGVVLATSSMLAFRHVEEAYYE